MIAENDLAPAVEKFSLANQCSDLEHDRKGEQVNNEVLVSVRAVYDYHANSDVELDFSRGDRILIYYKCNERWWWGEIDGCFGYVPVNYISSNLDGDLDQESDWQNDSYFEIYGHVKVQHEMLSDRARTLTYLKAIQQNSKCTVGTTVMDIGCGTGILSLFLARDGNAKKVYAVEASSANKIAENVIKLNGYDDRIEVVANMVEDLDIAEKVDLIVSEWMGTLLISEFMIESVIKARDMFLRPNGSIWPSRATLYLAPCSATEVYESAIKFWENVYGFDFSVVTTDLFGSQTGKPIHSHVAKEEDILAQPVSVVHLDMKTVTIESIEYIINEFEFLVSRPGQFNGFLHLVHCSF